MKQALRLFHLSDKPDIKVFTPRRPTRADLADTPLVWAVDGDHVWNYLLPRNCPRVTFFADKQTTPSDIAAFLGPSGASRVIAVEFEWLERISVQHLVQYEFDPQFFVLQDATAGHWTATEPIYPIAEILIENLLRELRQRGVELRVMTSLWELRDAVIQSTMAYSIMRMQHAGPPAAGFKSVHPLPTKRP